MASRRTGIAGDGSPAYAKKYLLTGIAICGKCGMHLSGHQRPRRPARRPQGASCCRATSAAAGATSRRAYGCGGIRRHAIPMDHFIREAIICRLDMPDLGHLLRFRLSKMETTTADQADGSPQACSSSVRTGWSRTTPPGLLTRDELAQAKLDAQAALDRWTPKSPS